MWCLEKIQHDILFFSIKVDAILPFITYSFSWLCLSTLPHYVSAIAGVGLSAFPGCSSDLCLGSVLGPWQSWSLSDASLGSNRQSWYRCKINWGWTGPGLKNGPQGNSERSGRPTQNLNRSTSKGAVPSKFSWVQWLESGAWRAFTEIKEWQTSIARRERAAESRGNKAMGGRQTE